MLRCRTCWLFLVVSKLVNVPACQKARNPRLLCSSVCVKNIKRLLRWKELRHIVETCQTVTPFSDFSGALLYSSSRWREIDGSKKKSTMFSAVMQVRAFEPQQTLSVICCPMLKGPFRVQSTEPNLSLTRVAFDLPERKEP